MPDIPRIGFFILCGLLLTLMAPIAFGQDAGQKSARLSGRVVDARTGEPIAKVKVIASGLDKETTTDDKGAFALEGLVAGKIDLYITTVTFGLVKKTIVLKEGDNSDVEIALNEDAAALTEKVTVTTAPFESTDNSVNQQNLNKRELQQLSSVLLNDPIRAAQALPGVSANDDFRSDFSVRGAAFDRVGLYLDGVLTENFLHTVAGGYPDTGSISVINADTVDSVSLMPGAFPANYGDRTAAILDIRTREGNRVKPAGRFQAALTGISGVVDGPFAKKRGSYLVAARKSFVGYLVRRFNDEFQVTNNPPVIDVADFQGKTNYDLSKQNQIGINVIFGNFVFDRNRDRNLLFINQVFRGTSRNLMVNAHWNFTPNSRVFWQTRFFGLRTDFKNTNQSDNVLLDETRTQYGGRSDISYQNGRNRVEAGLYARRIKVDSTAKEYEIFPPFSFDIGSFTRSAAEEGFYFQNTFNDERHRVTLQGGLRVEHSSVTKEAKLSPRGSFAWGIDEHWKVRLAAGRYYQFPDLNQMFGLFGNPDLKAERSTLFVASVERLIGARTRILAEVYDRQDSGLFFSANEPRRFGPFIGGFFFSFDNALTGYARGLELTFQRRSANKLAGWISYGYSRTLLHHSLGDVSFVSDSDQRHTLNVYGNYRFTETWNLSAEWRYGSGQPVPGFYGHDAAGFFVTTERNQTRVPFYSRADVRLSKAFIFKKAKLTLIGEVLNLFNRDNARFAGFDFPDFRTGRVNGQLDRLLPIVPSAGVIIDF